MVMVGQGYFNEEYEKIFMPNEEDIHKFSLALFVLGIWKCVMLVLTTIIGLELAFKGGQPYKTFGFIKVPLLNKLIYLIVTGGNTKT